MEMGTVNRHSLRFLLTFFLLFGLLPALAVAGPQQSANVQPQVWETLQAEGQADILVVLAEQADLSAASALPNKEAKGHYVYETLRALAEETQQGLRKTLDAQGVDYQPFYIVNAIRVQADSALVKSLAARPDVDRIAPNPWVKGIPDEQPRQQPDTTAPQEIEGNITRVNADDVWALGHTGEGIVVAGQDTGYDWEHPALQNQYRGWDGSSADHDYNWHDAIHTNSHGYNSCGVDSPEPCDDGSHGTHTMGTIVGDDGGSNQIGVAPGAQWIGCRNMDNGYGTPATYIECFEFFLAPYPLGGDPSTDGDPTKAPHVINNSWVCPPTEGCDPAAIQLMQTTVENVRAAGIVVVASAGNDGSPFECGRVMYPPAIYDAAFSIGATDSGDNISFFSSRGPVTVDGSNRRKPDVSAPGEDVRSSLPGGGYGLKDGTSMAGPHVVGTVALVWSAAPYLIGDVDATEWIIAHAARPRTTTQDCGDGPSDVPNNIYGWGIVDALSAVKVSQIGAEATFPPLEFPAQTLIYTLTFENAYSFPLTHVVLTDAIPAGTDFAWASGDYVHADGAVTWTAASLASHEMLTATLAVTVAHLPRGTNVINAFYGLHADELTTPVVGMPLETAVPWRYILLVVYRNWPAEENSDG
jgi:serine protease AprX